jgi:hypothetical protein
MKRHFTTAAITAALALSAIVALTRVATATDGILCTDGYCPTCVCGSCDIFNCGCGNCGYMLPVRRAQCYNWNGLYAHSAYGQPVALVVPPTANMQTNWGWGVGSARFSRLDHQVQRNYPGPGPYGLATWRRTPGWPSDTTQFGVYYVRGPW